MNIPYLIHLVLDIIHSPLDVHFPDIAYYNAAAMNTCVCKSMWAQDYVFLSNRIT